MKKYFITIVHIFNYVYVYSLDKRWQHVQKYIEQTMCFFVDALNIFLKYQILAGINGFGYIWWYIGYQIPIAT